MTSKQQTGLIGKSASTVFSNTQTRSPGVQTPSCAPRQHVQAVQNFKLRTLALLDAFATAVPGSGLIPGVLLDLNKAAEAAARPSGNVTIAERLRGVIGKLCRCVITALGSHRGYLALRCHGHLVAGKACCLTQSLP